MDLWKNSHGRNGHVEKRESKKKKLNEGKKIYQLENNNKMTHFTLFVFRSALQRDEVNRRWCMIAGQVNDHRLQEDEGG